MQKILVYVVDQTITRRGFDGLAPRCDIFSYLAAILCPVLAIHSLYGVLEIHSMYMLFLFFTDILIL